MSIDKSRIALKRYPFVRHVRCSCCPDRPTTPFEEFYTWKAYQFHLGPKGEFAGTCPKTGERQVWSVVDVTDDDAVIEYYAPWKPEELEEWVDQFTDTRQWVWNLPDDFVYGVLIHGARQLELLSTVPLGILRSVFLGRKFKFRPDLPLYTPPPGEA